VLLLVALLMIVSLAPRRTSSVTVDGHIAPNVSKLAVNVPVIRHNLLGELVWLVEASFEVCLCLLQRLLPLLVSPENIRLLLRDPALPWFTTEQRMSTEECTRVPLTFLP